MEWRRSRSDLDFDPVDSALPCAPALPVGGADICLSPGYRSQPDWEGTPLPVPKPECPPTLVVLTDHFFLQPLLTRTALWPVLLEGCFSSTCPRQTLVLHIPFCTFQVRSI